VTFGVTSVLHASVGRSQPPRASSQEQDNMVSDLSKLNSNSSQRLQAHREPLPKQQSFNSPKSLKDKLQLTSDKITSSLEKSSIN